MFVVFLVCLASKFCYSGKEGFWRNRIHHALKWAQCQCANYYLTWRIFFICVEHWFIIKSASNNFKIAKERCRDTCFSPLGSNVLLQRPYTFVKLIFLAVFEFFFFLNSFVTFEYFASREGMFRMHVSDSNGRLLTNDLFMFMQLKCYWVSSYIFILSSDQHLWNVIACE